MAASAWRPIDESAWKPVEETPAKATWTSHLGLTGGGEDTISPLGTLKAFARQGIDALQGAAHGAATTALNVPDVLGGGPIIRKVLGRPDPLAAVKKSIPEVPATTAGKVGEVGERTAEFFAGGEAAAGLSAGMKLLPRVLAQVASGGGVSAAQSGGDPTATAMGAAMGGIGSLVGEAINPLMASVGRKIQASTIRPRLTDMRNGFSWDAVDKLDLSGNLEQSLNQVQHRLAELRSTRNSMIAPGTATVDLQGALDDAEAQIIQDVQAGKHAGQGAKIKGAFNAMREDIENSLHTVTPGTPAQPPQPTGVLNPQGHMNMTAGTPATPVIPNPVDIRLAENAKEHMGTLGAWAYGRTDPDAMVTEEVANVLYPKIRERIEHAIGPLAPEVKALNQQMSELIPVKNAMIARLPVEERNRIFSLQDLAMLMPAMITGDPLYLGVEALSRGQKSLRLGNWLRRVAAAPSSGTGSLIKAGAQEALQPTEKPAEEPKEAEPEEPFNVGANQPRIGSTVTFKNGETGVIKAIQPDGTVEYE